MQVETHEVYQVNPTITFILTEEKILLMTPLQTCLITYANGNYKRRWYKLRDMIRRGEVTNLIDLHDYNGARVGGIEQIQGLVLVNTKAERYINV